MRYGDWAPYVSVAERKINAAKEMNKLRKKGLKIEPVQIQGRKIARTFWGEAWCNHIQTFSDYDNRLPRGRTYARNGSVCHLDISRGQITAFVYGSDLYKIKITISSLPAKKWSSVKTRCAGQIGSMLELLHGRFAASVMQIMVDNDTGLFPRGREINFTCNCPDRARMCKHVAAVLYGTAARLDSQPELLFLLRNVDHKELISTSLTVPTTSIGSKRRRLGSSDLSEVFDIEIDDSSSSTSNLKTKTKTLKSTRKLERKNHAQQPILSEEIDDVKSLKGVKGVKSVSKKKRSKSIATPSASSIIRLRRKFGMSPYDFAATLGVSSASVMKWEKSSGKLNLRSHTKAALIEASGYTIVQATKKLQAVKKRKKLW